MSEDRQTTDMGRKAGIRWGVHSGRGTPATTVELSTSILYIRIEEQAGYCVWLNKEAGSADLGGPSLQKSQAVNTWAGSGVLYFLCALPTASASPFPRV